MIVQTMLLFEPPGLLLGDLPLRACTGLIVDIALVANEYEHGVLQAPLHVRDPHALQVSQGLRATQSDQEYLYLLVDLVDE